MEKKKGQASMEFLMTYGWAILAAVLAVSVLAYYGVFNPGASLSDSCTLNPPLWCDQQVVNDTGVHLIIRNGAGSTANFTNVTVAGCGSITTIGNVANGANGDVFISCPSATTLGDTFTGAVTVKYLRSGKTLEETSTGTVRANTV